MDPSVSELQSSGSNGSIGNLGEPVAGNEDQPKTLSSPRSRRLLRAPIAARSFTSGLRERRSVAMKKTLKAVVLSV